MWPFDKNNSSKERRPVEKLDWPADSAFLVWYIDKRIEEFKILIIAPRAAGSDRAIPIGDAVVEEFVSVAAKSILGMISPDYQRQLTRYVAEGKIVDLVVDMLYTRLALIGIETNVRKIRKMNIESKE